MNVDSAASQIFSSLLLFSLFMYRSMLSSSFNYIVACCLLIVLYVDLSLFRIFDVMLVLLSLTLLSLLLSLLLIVVADC